MVGQPTSSQPVSMNKQDGNPSSPVHAETVSSNPSAFDRMEGSISGKNKPSVFKTGKRQHVVKNVGKEVNELAM